MSRRLASLVIASGRSPFEVTTAPADDETVSAAVGDTREWVRRVLTAHPTGLSKTAMRERVGGSHARLDAVLAELEDEDIITVRRGRQHVYRLAGPAGVEAGAPTPTPRPST